MRILAWNINHRTRKKAVPARIPASILSLNPDVVVMTEYVEGPDHVAFCAALAAGGLSVRFNSLGQGRHNQVLIASRSVANLGTCAPPGTLGHAASNCLRVHLVSPLLDLIGVRVPMYKSTTEIRSYWDWFGAAIEPLLASASVIIGDLNADPRRARGPASECLRRLVATGWQLPDPVGPWSYISTTGLTSRLDHALVSPDLTVTRAEYIVSANGFDFAGPGRGCLSDHTPLILDIVFPASDSARHVLGKDELSESQRQPAKIS